VKLEYRINRCRVERFDSMIAEVRKPALGLRDEVGLAGRSAPSGARGMADTEAAPPPIAPRPPSAKDRLIVALDFASADEALKIVERLGDTVSFYKIGLHLQLAPELHSLVAKLISAQKRLFLDFKYIDIPATVAGAVRAAAELGIDFVTVMGQRQIVRAAVEARGEAGAKILAVTLLTAMNEADLRREYHTGLTLPEFVERRAIAAERAGGDGVIASPNEIELIRAAVPTPDFLIVTPGIRPTGAGRDDQMRTATPYDAVVRGADYLVVGRPIIRAAEPRDAALRIIDEMVLALHDREGKAGSPAAAALRRTPA
jgi:orotidine-5'-phosphate decarboxylase